MQEILVYIALGLALGFLFNTASSHYHPYSYKVPNGFLIHLTAFFAKAN